MLCSPRRWQIRAALSLLPAGWLLSHVNELWQLFNSIIFRSRGFEMVRVEAGAGFAGVKRGLREAVGELGSFTPGVDCVPTAPQLPGTGPCLPFQNTDWKWQVPWALPALPPRGGIICPVTLGQRVPAPLCESEGRAQVREGRL